jgi:hypothetical protein
MSIETDLENERLQTLIDKYKSRIAVLQQKIKTFEKRGQAGTCISLTGEIQAYNAVIVDLKDYII